MRRALRASYAPGATIGSGPASSSRRRVVGRIVMSPQKRNVGTQKIWTNPGRLPAIARLPYRYGSVSGREPLHPVSHPVDQPVSRLSLRDPEHDARPEFLPIPLGGVWAGDH